jgi:low temperature requirement protein LtrA
MRKSGAADGVGTSHPRDDPEQGRVVIGPSSDVRVSSIELFFDLVFVFAITQLTTLLVAEPTGLGVARVALIFGNIWWMYGGYAWLTNAVPPRGPSLRVLLLGGMIGFLVVALAIPHAFGDSGVAFGAGYLVVTLVHTGLFLRSSQEGAARAMLRLGPYNFVTAALLLAAGFTHGTTIWVLWTGAFVFHWASPAVTAVGDFRIHAPHFVERHGLIVLIALGESIVAVGIGVRTHRLTAGLALTAVLALALAAALWWLYFDGEDERAEQALDKVPETRAPWLGLFAYGYAFLPLLGGIVVFAAGVRLGIVRYDQPASAATAWFLAAGVSAYIGALALFRWILRIGSLVARLVMAAGALVSVVLGLEVSPEVQIAALVLLVVAGITAEVNAARRVASPPIPSIR